jgi:hypothetical protein
VRIPPSSEVVLTTQYLPSLANGCVRMVCFDRGDVADGGARAALDKLPWRRPPTRRERSAAAPCDGALHSTACMPPPVHFQRTALGAHSSVACCFPQAFYKMFGHTPVAEMHSIAQGMGMNYIVFDRFALNTFVRLLSAQIVIRCICCFCIS